MRKLCTLAAAVVAAFASSLSAQVGFLGVAAGDATDTSVVLWTRAVDASLPAQLTLTVDVTTDPSFVVNVNSGSVATDPAKDYTAKATVTGLLPATRYYYRFGSGAQQSGVGTFKTAPVSTASAAVRFAFSGDCDGLMRPYPLASRFPGLNLDFFVFLGDTMYETASSGSPATALTGTQPAPSATGATQAQLFADYARKYREQFAAVNVGGQNCLQPLFASQGNYTLLDNHELGNRQYINGGADPGGPVADMTAGAGVDARQSVNDANISGAFMNKTAGFQILQRVYFDYQPVQERGLVVAPADPRSNGSVLQYFAQRWGRNAIFVNVDDRSYRDIRMKTAANADETTSPRADNPARTMLGATQLQWLEQTLLAARDGGVIWKFVALSSPIDQLGPIGVLGTPSDGGKSWMGQYRAERNILLRFIADNHIENVVFLATDDHENRVNEVLYSPTGQTAAQSSYVRVPRCFTIVCGPLGATGPETITDHSFANITALANARVSVQTSAGLDPMGLAPDYPGLRNVTREAHPTANLVRAPVDFYSPDTFNLATFDVSADGAILTVAITGIDSRATNTFGEYDPAGNPARQILSFQVDAFTPCGDPVCGQHNTPCATMLVNGSGLEAQGPVHVSVPAFTNLAFDWRALPNAPLALFAGTLVPGQRPFGDTPIVDLDVPTAQVLFSGFDLLWGPLFTTDAQGLAAQSFRVPPSLTGFVLATQGVVFDLAGSCSAVGFVTTASFVLHF